MAKRQGLSAVRPVQGAIRASGSDRRDGLTGLRAEAAVYGIAMTAPSPTRAQFAAAVDDYFFSSITIPRTADMLS